MTQDYNRQLLSGITDVCTKLREIGKKYKKMDLPDYAYSIFTIEDRLAAHAKAIEIDLQRYEERQKAKEESCTGKPDTCVCTKCCKSRKERIIAEKKKEIGKVNPRDGEQNEQQHANANGKIKLRDTITLPTDELLKEIPSGIIGPDEVLVVELKADRFIMLIELKNTQGPSSQPLTHKLVRWNKHGPYYYNSDIAYCTREQTSHIIQSLNNGLSLSGIIPYDTVNVQVALADFLFSKRKIEEITEISVDDEVRQFTARFPSNFITKSIDYERIGSYGLMLAALQKSNNWLPYMLFAIEYMDATSTELKTYVQRECSAAEALKIKEGLEKLETRSLFELFPIHESNATIFTIFTDFIKRDFTKERKKNNDTVLTDEQIVGPTRYQNKMSPTHFPRNGYRSAEIAAFFHMKVDQILRVERKNKYTVVLARNDGLSYPGRPGVVVGTSQVIPYMLIACYHNDSFDNEIRTSKTEYLTDEFYDRINRRLKEGFSLFSFYTKAGSWSKFEFDRKTLEYKPDNYEPARAEFEKLREMGE